MPTPRPPPRALRRRTRDRRAPRRPHRASANPRARAARLLGRKKRRVGTVVGRKPRAPVERPTRQIERQRGTRTAHPHVDERVRLLGIDLGPTPRLPEHPVAHRVLHLERGEAGVAQLVVRAVRLHGDARPASKDVLPRKAPHALVQALGVRRVNAPHHREHARGEPRPQARGQRAAHVAERGHAPGKRAHAPHAHAPELIGERRFQTGEAAREQFDVFVFHGAGPIIR